VFNNAVLIAEVMWCQIIWQAM